MYSYPKLVLNHDDLGPTALRTGEVLGAFAESALSSQCKNSVYGMGNSLGYLR